MNREDIPNVVNEVVERIARRLSDTTHGDLPTPADERMFDERRRRLQQAVEAGACRLTPQALSLDQCGELASMVEQALLRPDAREDEVRALCRDAIERGNAAVCVAIEWAEVAASELRGSQVRLTVPVGFPSGGLSTEAKTAEVRRALSMGADEVDVVLNARRLQQADYYGVVEDFHFVLRAAQGKPFKAVIDIASLTFEQKLAAVILARAGGASFVKSATGFEPDGVTVDDVTLMRNALAGAPVANEPASARTAPRVGAVVSLAIGSSPPMR
jgi:deoxyribose-phosphate aldolase